MKTTDSATFRKAFVLASCSINDDCDNDRALEVLAENPNSLGNYLPCFGYLFYLDAPKQFAFTRQHDNFGNYKGDINTVADCVAANYAKLRQTVKVENVDFFELDREDVEDALHQAFPKLIKT